MKSWPPIAAALVVASVALLSGCSDLERPATDVRTVQVQKEFVETCEAAGGVAYWKDERWNDTLACDILGTPEED